MLDIKIAVVGKNEIVREGLKRILAGQGFDVVATANGPVALLAASVKSDPDIILVETTAADLASDDWSCARERFSQARVALISDDCAIATTIRALVAGADGHLFNTITSEQLVAALQMIAMGEKVMPSEAISELVAHPLRSGRQDWQAGTGDTNLSDREVEILGCLVHGDANKLISRQLTISEATVKVHVKAILRKLRVLNRTQAAIWAVSHGVMGGPRAAPMHYSAPHA